MGLMKEIAIMQQNEVNGHPTERELEVAIMDIALDRFVAFLDDGNWKCPNGHPMSDMKGSYYGNAIGSCLGDDDCVFAYDIEKGGFSLYYSQFSRPTRDYYREFPENK